MATQPSARTLYLEKMLAEQKEADKLRAAELKKSDKEKAKRDRESKLKIISRIVAVFMDKDEFYDQHTINAVIAKIENKRERALFGLPPLKEEEPVKTEQAQPQNNY